MAALFASASAALSGLAASFAHAVSSSAVAAASKNLKIILCPQ
jgi:hypothetical protein